MVAELPPGGKEPQEKTTQVQPLHLLTRLIVGGIEISAAELLHRLARWEADIQKQLDSNPSTETGNNLTPHYHPTQSESTAKLARLALIGLIFELQDGVKNRLNIFRKLGDLVTRTINAILQPVGSARIFSPTLAELDRWIIRGEQEVSRWIATGRYEEKQSRLLANYAFDELTDEYIKYLAAKPEVQDLVQTQSTGLANEVIEEVRERTISADTFLESLARSLLRRSPRSNLPEPQIATRLRSSSKQSPRKDKRSN
jgi:hypothetical protein